MRELLSGAIAAGSAVAALYFLRFWRDSADRLFGFFAGAFALMTVNAVALGVTSPDDEFRIALYVVRLAAFVLILAGIADRNRQAR